MFTQDLQDQIESKLQLKKVPVIKHANDLESMIEEHFLSNTSHCVIINNPLPEKVTPLDDGAVAFDRIKVTIRIIQNALFKEEDVTALGVAEEVSKLLHNFRPAIPGWYGVLTLEENKPWKETKGSSSKNYELTIHFTAQGSPQ